MRHTILLADDSPTIQRLVNQTFADTKFDIVTVNNGDAAIRKFDEIEPDLVLADIYMPGKNGYEVCAHVKGHASLAGTPVILLVGAFDAFDEATASQAGANGHITKPFEPRALVELVTSTVPPVARAKKTATSAPEAVPAAVVEEPVVPEPPQASPQAPPQTPSTEPDPVPDPFAAPVVTPSGLRLQTTAHMPEAIPEEQPAIENIPSVVMPPADLSPVVENVAEVTPVIESSSSVINADGAASLDGNDLLGLENLFQPETAPASDNSASQLTEDQIEKIVDRVIRKLSTQVIEGIAWDVVPDIATKILRDELKKTNS